MTDFEWSPALETGNAEIDEQHRTMFQLANRLHEVATGEPDPSEALEDAIYQLTEYVLEHFSAEEALMRQSGYPALGSHEGLHKNLAGDTMRLAASHFNGDPLAATRIGPFVANWFRGHIATEDQRFAVFARARRD